MNCEAQNIEANLTYKCILQYDQHSSIKRRVCDKGYSSMHESACTSATFTQCTDCNMHYSIFKVTSDLIREGALYQQSFVFTLTHTLS